MLAFSCDRTTLAGWRAPENPPQRPALHDTKGRVGQAGPARHHERTGTGCQCGSRGSTQHLRNESTGCANARPTAEGEAGGANCVTTQIRTQAGAVRGGGEAPPQWQQILVLPPTPDTNEYESMPPSWHLGSG